MGRNADVNLLEETRLGRFAWWGIEPIRCPRFLILCLGMHVFTQTTVVILDILFWILKGI